MRDDEHDDAHGDANADEHDDAHDDAPDDVVARLLVAVRDRLDDVRTRTLDEIAADVGAASGDLGRLFDAAGRRHDDGRYGDRDIRYARGLAQLLERFEVGVLERALRLNQRSVTTMAVNQLTLVQADRRLAPLVTREPDEHLADLLAREARETLDVVQRLLVEDHQEALLRLLDSQVVAEASRTLGEVLDVAVCFVDLVGFTRLSASVDPSIVGEVLGVFEHIVHAEADRVGEVLVVKFIGDAAMLLGGEADRVVDVALGIIDAEAPALDDVARRAGLATGRVQARDGDYVGTPVNLAARLTDLARPQTVVASADAEQRLDEQWRRSRLPATRLKGLGRIRATRIRRPATDH